MTTKYKQSERGCYYHIYNRGNQKQNIFIEKSDYRYYLEKLKENSEKYNFVILNYCLMPNHIHLLVWQQKDYSPSKLIACLHTSYSMRFNKKYEKVGHLFQGRFNQKIIADDGYLEQLKKYIHQNPVKNGLCKTAEEYPWSSASRTVLF